MTNSGTNLIKKTIFSHLDSKKYQVFLFGSRASGSYQPNSDWDIGIMGKKPLPTKVRAKIEKKLENSPIPEIVELVDFYYVSEEFKKLALKDAVLWKPNSK